MQLTLRYMKLTNISETQIYIHESFTNIYETQINIYGTPTNIRETHSKSMKFTLISIKLTQYL